MHSTPHPHWEDSTGRNEPLHSLPSEPCSTCLTIQHSAFSPTLTASSIFPSTVAAASYAPSLDQPPTCIAAYAAVDERSLIGVGRGSR